MLGILSLVTCFAGNASWAQPVVIDTWGTVQGPLSLTFPPAGTTISSLVTGVGILGSERDIRLNLTGGVIAGNRVSASVASNFFSYGQDATIQGNATIQWDGNDGNPTTLNPVGLGGIDLTNGGTQDAFLLNTAFDDLPVDVAIQVYTNAGNSSSLVTTFPGAVFSTTNFLVPFSQFTVTNGSGVDFTNVGAITLTVGSAVTAPDFIIGEFRTTSILEATKRDSLQVDQNLNGSVDPGDTVRYTVQISNEDDAFNGDVVSANFTSGVDGNSSLVVGSVTTSQGSVTTGNNGGDSSVAVNIGTIADADTITITFDVVVDSPLDAFVSQISCQGFVTSTITNLPTDDPDTPAPHDATITPILAAPDVTATKSDVLFSDNDLNGVPSPGDVLKYTVFISNSGPQDAVGVEFELLGAFGLELNAGSVTTTQGTVIVGNGPGATDIQVNIGTLDGLGGFATVMFEATIQNPFPANQTEVTCQGLVTGDNFPDVPTDDPETVTLDDSTTTTITAAPQINAGKTAMLFTDADGDTVPSPGDTLKYTVTIANDGNQNTTGVMFAIDSAAHVSLVPGSVMTSLGSVTTGNGGGDTTVVVNVGNLNGQGQTATIMFRAVISNPVPAGVDEVRCQGTVSGPNFSTSVAATTPIEADPIITATKTDSIFIDSNSNGRVEPGETIKYTIVVSNTGNENAAGVIFSSSAPANTNFVVGSVMTSKGSIQSGNTVGNNDVRVNIGSLAGDIGVATVMFRATIIAPFPMGATQVLCQGVVVGDNFPDVPTDDPTTPEPDDSTITRIFQPPTAICEDLTVSVDGDCEVTITPEDIDNGSFDPDGGPVTLALVPPGPYGVGNHVVQLVVTDDEGDSSVCEVDISVVDDEDPVIPICPTIDQVTADGSGQALVPNVLNLIVPIDNCTGQPNLILSQNPPVGTVVNVGTTQIIIVVMDESGNTVECGVPFVVIAPTATPSATFSSTPTPTPSSTVTETFTATPSSTFTVTQTPSASPTTSFTQTATTTSTVTETPTTTASATPSRTASFTATASATASRTATETSSPTISPTPTITSTPGCDSGLYMLLAEGAIERIGNPVLISGGFNFANDLAKDLERVVADEDGTPNEDLAVLDGTGIVSFVENAEDNIAQDFLFQTSSSFPTGRAVDLQFTKSGEGFWVLTDFGGIYRAGDAKEPAEPALLPGSDQMGILGYDIPYGDMRDGNVANPGGSSLRAVGFVVIDVNPPANRADGYILIDSQGGHYQLESNGSFVVPGTYLAVPQNDELALLEPKPDGYKYPFFPGLDIARDIELFPGSENGLVIYDGWGGIHPVPVNDPLNPVFYTRNEDPLNPGNLITTVGMPYIIAGFDDPETGENESNAAQFGVDVFSIFTDFEFSAGCPEGGFYVLDKNGGVFVFGEARPVQDSLLPAWPLPLISSQDAVQIEIFDATESGPLGE